MRNLPAMIGVLLSSFTGAFALYAALHSPNWHWSGGVGTEGDKWCVVVAFFTLSLTTGAVGFCATRDLTKASSPPTSTE